MSVKPRRVYTAEFKREVLREYYETGASQIAIERKYNIGISCLSRWIKDEQANQQNAFPGHGRLSADKAEIARLQKELERGKQTKQILEETLRLLAEEQKDAS